MLTYVLIGVVVVVGAIWLIVTIVTEVRERNEVLANGVPMLAWIVQANGALYQPGTEPCPALVLISFPGERTATNAQLEELASRVAYLKTARPANDMEASVARLVIDERNRPGVRNRLPDEFTGGQDVYTVNVDIHPSLLPGTFITRPYIHCKAIPGDRGMVVMEPYPS